jgi:hypothetical protein
MTMGNSRKFSKGIGSTSDIIDQEKRHGKDMYDKQRYEQ